MWCSKKKNYGGGGLDAEGNKVWLLGQTIETSLSNDSSSDDSAFWKRKDLMMP